MSSCQPLGSGHGPQTGYGIHVFLGCGAYMYCLAVGHICIAWLWGILYCWLWGIYVLVGCGAYMYWLAVAYTYPVLWLMAAPAWLFMVPALPGLYMFCDLALTGGAAHALLPIYPLPQYEVSGVRGGPIVSPPSKS